MVLGMGDCCGFNIWFVCLLMEVKEKDEWCYWQVDLLLECGCDVEVKEIFYVLMQKCGFYLMVVVQCLGEEYMFKIDKVFVNVNSVLMQGLEMVCVWELMYWNLDNMVCSEWVNLVKSCSKFEQVQLVCYVFNQYWWDLSVQVMIVGKLWDYLEECFLLVYNDFFICYICGKDIL